ncbi:MAG: hypothetical protein ACREJB_03545 [Planctomycetaceae bacterium]
MRRMILTLLGLGLLGLATGCCHHLHGGACNPCGPCGPAPTFGPVGSAPQSIGPVAGLGNCHCQAF